MSPKKKSPEKKGPTEKMPTKRKVVIPKENSPPAKRPRRNVRPREEHDFKDFVTSNVLINLLTYYISLYYISFRIYRSKNNFRLTADSGTEKN